jgi:RNA polymerase sigma-54 factor
MLQMPILKLEQTIRQELSINPLLEEIEDLELESPDSEAEVDLKESESEKVDWDEYLYEDDEGYKVREFRESLDEPFEGTAAPEKNLYTHLSEQLNYLKLSEEDHLIGEYIIGNISPDGYLAISVPEMSRELSIEEARIEQILSLIQRFDPSGVGARDLRESLLIQLREKELEDSLPYRIVDEHIHELDRKSLQQIARLMGVPLERAQQAMDLIKTLSPTPAHGRFASPAMAVVPDLVVERLDDAFAVYHNDRHVPRLRINSSYRELMKKSSASSPNTRDYIKQKLEQARWLLNAINQRRSTMIRVMESIIERQSDFFERGPAFLKPLIMEEIAQMVNMNVATISRVSKGKYVQTPFGVFEIKHFFNTGISRSDGEDVSKRSVKERIEDLIKQEPPDKPLSDQEIYRKLNDEGIKLARRTVTKYREELNLPAARLRRRVTAS